MPDADAKAKAEKLAAAKKRVEQLKKAKQKKDEAKADGASGAAVNLSSAEEKHLEVEASNNEGRLAPGDASLSNDDAPEEMPTQSAPSHGRKPSLSVQSKIRSSSFRQSITSPSLIPSAKNPSFDAEEDTAPEIYKKQAARIEELEKDNKRLIKEAMDGEKRWRKAEEELEDLREAEVDGPEKRIAAQTPRGTDGELDKLRSEIAALQRQNTQLQAQASRPIRHSSSPSISQSSASNDDLTALLASKSSTIEGMEIEISNLRAQLARSASGTTAEKEQITALKEQLSRTQKSLDTSQRELLDLKKNLEHTTTKYVKEGSERTSAETKLKTLTREAEEAKAQTSNLEKKVESLDRKVLTLTTLHKEHDARSQVLKKERKEAEKESADLRQRLASIENENLRLREERERSRKREAQGVDDEGVDELENEERLRLEAKVRDLEAEVFDLRRGIYREMRGLGSGDEPSETTSPGAKFTDIDLGATSPGRRRSIAQGGSATKGLTDVFVSTFATFVGGADRSSGYSPGHSRGGIGMGMGMGTAPNDELLEDDDEAELEFDEEAFRLAQEEASRKRLERIREVKRALPEWKGWRMDLVELRKGGGEGVGEIFEV